MFRDTTALVRQRDDVHLYYIFTYIMPSHKTLADVATLEWSFSLGEAATAPPKELVSLFFSVRFTTEIS
jgi:hypothetical protein